VDTKVSHDDTVSWTESRWAAWRPKPADTAVALAHAFRFGKWLLAAAPTHANDRDWRAGAERLAIATSR
jgi:hypothetical protein